MGVVSGYGRKQPNGKKIMQLRREKGIKQESLADRAKISVRLLRDIERLDHPVRTTTITSIAAELMVNPDDIILSREVFISFGQEDTGTVLKILRSLLKLLVVRSATELSDLATRASKYEWQLKIDPSEATAADMQKVMMIVERLIAASVGWRTLMPSGFLTMPPTEYVGPLEPIDDEFDKQAFGEIPRLALLQDLLTRLRNNGVNVIAGTYTYSWLRGLKEDERPLFSDDSQIWVCVPREDTRRIFQTERVLSIHLVPSDVEEEVVPIKTGLSLEDFERHDGPF